LKYSLHYVPKDFNTEEKTLELKHQSKFKPSLGFFETTQTLKFGSPKLGPLRLWTTLAYIWNTEGVNNKIKHSLNVDTGSDVHIGYKLTHDFNKIAKCFGVLFYRNAKAGDFFLKSECIKRHLIFGHVKKNECCSHTSEVHYDLNKEQDGLLGQHLKIRVASEGKISDSIHIKSLLELSKEHKLSFSWT